MQGMHQQYHYQFQYLSLPSMPPSSQNQGGTAAGKGAAMVGGSSWDNGEDYYGQ